MSASTELLVRASVRGAQQNEIASSGCSPTPGRAGPTRRDEVIRAVELARAADDHDALLIVVGTRGEGLRVAILRLIEPSVSHG